MLISFITFYYTEFNIYLRFFIEHRKHSVRWDEEERNFILQYSVNHS